MITVSNSWAISVLDYGLRIGISKTELDSALGFSAEVFRSQSGRVDLESVVKLWQVSADLSKDSAFGLRFGENIRVKDLHVVGFLLMTSQTLGSAFESLMHYQPIISQGGLIGVTRRDESFDIWYQPQPFQTPFSYHQIDAVLMAIVNFTKFLSGGNTVPEYAELTGARKDLEPYKGLAGSLRPNSRMNLLRYNSALLEMPCINACPDLFRLHKEYADSILQQISKEASITSLVCSTILSGFGCGEISKSDIAAAMNLSERTLQRRLSESNVTFQQLLDFTRQQTAINQLKYTSTDIAELYLYLGFADASSFYKAFKRWTGLSIRQWLGQN